MWKQQNFSEAQQSLLIKLIIINNMNQTQTCFSRWVSDEVGDP